MTYQPSLFGSVVVETNTERIELGARVWSYFAWENSRIYPLASQADDYPGLPSREDWFGLWLGELLSLT